VTQSNAKNTYATKERATAAAIELGRQVIDGEIPGLSV